MNRIMLFYRSYVLYLFFLILSALSVVGAFTPIFTVTSDNENITLGKNIVRILDISYRASFGDFVLWGTTNFGYLIFFIFGILFLTGTYFYVSRRRALAKTLYDLLLLFNISQLLALVIRYIQLQFHISNYPDDEISIFIGNYVYILIGVIVIGVVIRYFYVGVERRNSVYIYRKSS